FSLAPPPPDLSPLSLHDALPISWTCTRGPSAVCSIEVTSHSSSRTRTTEPGATSRVASPMTTELNYRPNLSRLRRTRLGHYRRPRCLAAPYLPRLDRSPT